MVNLVASEGSEFASVTVRDGVVLYVDGSGAEVPFAWFMGGRFGFRVGRVGFGDCGHPEWKGEFFERSVNGPGSEMIPVESVTSGVAAEPGALVLAGAFAALLVDVVGEAVPPLVLSLMAESGDEYSAMVLWLVDVLEALEPLAVDALAAHAAQEAAESFSTLELDEV